MCSIHLQYFGLQHVVGSATITQLLESNLTFILIRFLICYNISARLRSVARSLAVTEEQIEDFWEKDS